MCLLRASCFMTVGVSIHLCARVTSGIRLYPPSCPALSAAWTLLHGSVGRVTSHLIVQTQMDVGKTLPTQQVCHFSPCCHIFTSICINPVSRLQVLNEPIIWEVCSVWTTTLMCVSTWTISDPRLHYLAGCAGVAQGYSLSQLHALGVATRPALPPLYRLLSHTKSEYMCSLQICFFLYVVRTFTSERFISSTASSYVVGDLFSVTESMTNITRHIRSLV